jgi:hypothetical protein
MTVDLRRDIRNHLTRSFSEISISGQAQRADGLTRSIGNYRFLTLLGRADRPLVARFSPSGGLTGLPSSSSRSAARTVSRCSAVNDASRFIKPNISDGLLFFFATCASGSTLGMEKPPNQEVSIIKLPADTGNAVKPSGSIAAQSFGSKEKMLGQLKPG